MVRGREGEARPRSRPPGGSRTPQKGMHLCSARRASTGRSARRGGSAPRLLRARLARLAPGAAAPDGRGHDGAPDRHRRPPRGIAPRRVKARGAEPAGCSAERSLSRQRPRGAGPNGRRSRATKFLAEKKTRGDLRPKWQVTSKRYVCFSCLAPERCHKVTLGDVAVESQGAQGDVYVPASQLRAFHKCPSSEQRCFCGAEDGRCRIWTV